MKPVDSTLLERLERVLACAVQAPGNRQRFELAGLMGGDGRLVADWQGGFERLSLLRKAQLRASPGAFLVSASDVVYRGKTSGTTSEAFTYFAGGAWNQKRVAARARSQRWWGVDDAPVVNVASRLGPIGLGDSSLIGPVDYGFLVSLLKVVGEGPVVLRGYPSRLCEVAIALHRNQLQLPANAVVAVVATGECLFSVQRSRLKQTFKAPVVNEYGCQESGISGMSCPEAGRIHLDEDRCLYEMIDGELVTTDLWNTTMPMVRYVSGDAIAPYADSCPCGRAGLTAKILGRQDNVLPAGAHQRRSGELDMPPFPGILNYQIRIENGQRRVWVQLENALPERALKEKTLAPVKSWFEQTFGAGATDVFVASPFAEPVGELAASALNAVSSEMWLENVTQQKWGDWMEQPLPMGAARDVAALLQQMVVPQQVVGRGLSAPALRLMQALRKSALTPDHRLEAMKLRVLFWALSLMTQQGQPHGKAGVLEAEVSEAEAVEDIYCELMSRFQAWCDRCSDLSLFSALGFDVLAPLLTLASGAGHWEAVRLWVSKCWPNGIKADRFTLHHYLTAVDIAGQNAQRRGHGWRSVLRPLSAVLLGDFFRVGSALSRRQIEVWMEMVHERPGAFGHEGMGSAFEQVRRDFRRSLLRKNKADSLRHLDSLFGLAIASLDSASADSSQADSRKAVAQCWLEKGYANLVFEVPFMADEWLEILRGQVGVLSGEGKAVVNPMAWSPILKAVAPALVDSGRTELAYACLFAAAPPNRQLSGFDRLSVGVNGKQSVISVVQAVV